ncbi:MAG: insulinase family protein [Sandaracinaceae bacterium]|nr:insulinase family protein [Sandaracinaceae bacterium]
MKTPRFVLPALGVAIAGVALVHTITRAQDRVATPQPPPAHTAIRATPPVPTANPASTIFPHAPTVDHLPNGLTVISVPWDTPGIVAYYTVMRVGSRDEVEAGHSGFAHLFEHMMFRGTERFPEEVYERTIQSFGADNNAFTSNDYTCYTVTAPSTALPRIVELEADRFQHLQYDETQFRTETGAVLGEYNKSAADPSMIMDETMSELAFSRHTYRHTVIGYLRDVRAMPGYYDYSRNFFRRFYTPDNATIVVVGDVQHAALMELVRAQYSAWNTRRDSPRIPVEPEPRAGASRHLDWDGSSPPRLWVAYRVPAFEAGNTPARRQASLRETAALQVIHAYAFSQSSPLYQSLVVDQQKVLELSSMSGSYTRDPGLFLIAATLKPETDFPSIQTAMQNELSAIAAGRADAARLEAVKSNLRYGLLMALETPDDVAGLIASILSVTGDLASLDAYLSALASVTADDVQHAARTYLTDSRRFIVTLAPRATAQQPVAAGAVP